MSSLPKRNEGVAMYVKIHYGFRAIMHQEWNTNMIVVANKELAVVTVYVSQGWREQIMSDLTRTVK